MSNSVYTYKTGIVLFIMMITGSSLCSQNSSGQVKNTIVKRYVTEKPLRNSNEVEVVAISGSGKDEYIFKFTNTTESVIDICYVFKRTSGKWSDVRGINNVKPGAKVEGSGYNTTGEIVVYLRKAGSSHKCITSSDLR